MPRVTLSDIARELNLNPSSVARALSERCGNTRISEETRRRVREAAARLHYRSHSAGRSLSTRRFQNIGFFTVKKVTSDYSYAESVYEGLADAAAEHGQNVVLARLPRIEAGLDEIPRALREQCLDAVVIYDSASLLPGFQAAVAASGLPVVYLNEKQPTNAVYVDDVLSGQLMTEHLIARGYRRITMLLSKGERTHYSTPDRVAGYEKTMREAGLEPDIRSFNNKFLLEQASPWLSSSERPEAIFCHGDILAMALFRVLYALGLHVPKDIAVAGCDGEEHALRSVVPLTTLEIPFRAMAAEALRMALRLVREPGSDGVPSVVFHPRLLPSVSTGCPPSPHPTQLSAAPFPLVKEEIQRNP